MRARFGRMIWRGTAGAALTPLFAITLLVSLAPPSAVRAQEVAQAVAPEYVLKAAYLYKFAPFVAWPPQSFPTATTPLSICIAGQDPFGSVVDQAVQGVELGARPVIVRRVPSVESADNCHILYIGQNGGSPAGVRGGAVLTVTDGERSPGEKGIIHFVIRGNRVRFEIDDLAAQVSGLNISSKLLSLAETVRQRS